LIESTIQTEESQAAVSFLQPSRTAQYAPVSGRQPFKPHHGSKEVLLSAVNDGTGTSMTAHADTKRSNSIGAADSNQVSCCLSNGERDCEQSQVVQSLTAIDVRPSK
jgi:hypothetical protein